jgi:hypothetical protein
LAKDARVSRRPWINFIQVAEVEAMFAAAAVYPPRPDFSACNEIAKQIRIYQLHANIQKPLDSHEEGKIWFANELFPTHFIYASEAKRRRDAINVLRRAVAQTRKVNGGGEPEENAAYAALLIALEAVEPLLVGGPVSRGVKPWHVWSMMIAELALNALIACGRRGRTVSRRSIAAHFTELASKRIGLGNIQREAIADRWARSKRKRPL